MPKSQSPFFKSIVSILSGKVIILSISLVLTPILVRLVSVESYGTFVTVFAFLGVIELISKGGIFDATRKYVAETTSEEERFGVISGTIILGTLYGIFATVLVLIFEFSFGIPGIQRNHLLILLPAILLGNIVSVCQGFFYGQQRERVTEISRILRQLCYAAIGLGLTATSLGIVGMFIGYTVSALLVGLGLGVVVFLELQLDRQGEWIQLPSRTSTIARYGALQAVGGIAAILLYKTDILLVSYFSGASSAGIYRSALTPAEYIWFVPGTIQMAMLQNVSNLWSQDKRDQINENVSKGIKYSVLSLSLLAIGLFPLAEEFLEVYFGPGYIGGSIALKILLIGTFGFGLARVVIPVFQATGWLRYTEALTVGALVVNIGLNIILIPKYGIEGAAVATSFSYTLMFCGSAILWWRSEFRLMDKMEVPRWFGAMGTFAIVYLGANSFIPMAPLHSLVILPVLGGVIFFTCCLTFGIFSYEQVREGLLPIQMS